MSEPTYRVELTHRPEYEVEHFAQVFHVGETVSLVTISRDTREEAFEAAQEWARDKSKPALPAHTVLLTEDGEIHDRFSLAP